MTTPIPPLNAQESRVLKHLAEGGVVKCHRNFPHGFHYHLENGKGYCYAAELADSTIAALVSGHLIDSNWRSERDDFEIHISEEGKEAIARGTVWPPDKTQLVLIEEPI